MFVLVGTVNSDADIGGLFLGQSCKLGAQLLKVESCNLFVKFFVQQIDPHFTVGIAGNVDLSKSLVGEAVGHDE